MLREAAGDDERVLAGLVARRETGEPVEWIVGWAQFCGLRVRVNPGVYVPRVQTEALAVRAAAALPEGGVAVDLATGSGAIAMVLSVARPTARVVATELDPVAAACARANGVEVYEGDLDAGLPVDLCGKVDIVTANVPYVPTAAIAFLPRDVQQYEPRLALDGGADGLDLVRRVVEEVAPRLLKPGTGVAFVEVGVDQSPDRVLEVRR